MQDSLIKKSIVLIIALFLGAGFIQNISSSECSYCLKINKEIANFEHILDNNLIFYPTDDSFIKHGSPDANYGDLEELRIRNDYGEGSSGFAYDTLIKFDVSSIPVKTIIESATLYVYYYKWDDNSPSGRAIRIYRATSNWDEETVTWNSQPSYKSQTSDYAQVPVFFGWMSWDVTTDIQTFVNEVESNYGWKITDNNYWGTYDIPITYFRSKEHDELNPYLEIDINDAPKGPFIMGPTHGSPGIEYEYSFYAFDPEGHNVYFWIQWGDTDEEFWIGPYKSGEQVTLNHTWDEEDNYFIRAKARDIYNYETEWSSLEVIMPKNRLLTNYLLFRLFERFPILQRILYYIL